MSKVITTKTAHSVKRHKRTPYIRLDRALKAHKNSLPIPPRYQELLSGGTRTMTEVVTEINENRPIRLVHLALPRGRIVDPSDKAIKEEVERVISLVDRDSGRPISIGVLKIFTGALKKYDKVYNKVIDQIKEGTKPFGEIVREISKQYGIDPTIYASRPHAVKTKELKAVIKGLFSNPESEMTRRVVDEFGLNDEETVIYGRYGWMQLGRDNICKAIDFLRPGLE